MSAILHLMRWRKFRSGIALLTAVGVLTVLSLIVTSAAFIAKTDYRAAINFTDQVRARYIAEAGAARALAELKYGAQGARNELYDTAAEAWFAGLSGNFGAGTYTVSIADCGQLINLNDANASMLRMLFTLSGMSTLQAVFLAGSIIAQRTALGGKFATIEEMKLSAQANVNSMFNNVSSLLTVAGSADNGTGHTSRVFINVNTAPANVLKVVLIPLLSVPAEADAIVAAIVNRRTTNPFDGRNPDSTVNNFISARGEFVRYIDTLAIAAANKQAIFLYTDPNRNNDSPPAVSPSTYFSFDGGGCYQITSSGHCGGMQQRISMNVRVFDRWYQTTKAEFDQGVTYRATTRDNTPINVGVCYNGFTFQPANAQEISGAIKPGFWDDFSDNAYSLAEWLPIPNGLGTPSVINLTAGMLLTAYPGAFPTNRFPKIQLGMYNPGAPRWVWADAKIIMHVEDEVNGDYGRAGLPAAIVPFGWGAPVEPPPGEPADISITLERYMNSGWLQFRISDLDEVSAYISQRQPESGWTWKTSIWKYFAPVAPPDEKLSEELIISTMSGLWHDSVPAYVPDKTFHLLNIGNTATLQAHWATGSSTPVIAANIFLNRSDGVIALFGMDNCASMDNVRVIPRQSVFTSAASPNVGSVDWGTISAGVSFSPAAVAGTSEDVVLSTSFSENLAAVPAATYDPKTDAGLVKIPASGGAIPANAAGTIRYRLYLLSNHASLEEIPVVEDVTVTYLPQTAILYQKIN
ncbi:MAG: type II secretion system protein GspK [Candidatus Omnitrophica bacterium]|nr:type II secretion system protein GspK [Candidatus Omnitrophota bacterium]